ncbi:MAG: polyhydroxyalkanoate depolymerase [Planctomycetes bacterium]|nr:polyhydroxyalkanoate depolymerase [Planctomycetota bacterium]
MPRALWSILVSLTVISTLRATDPGPLERALERAGGNRDALERALGECSERERVGMRFLIENMPQRDLETLGAEFLIAHVRTAYTNWDTVPWKERIPEAIFLDAVLPYSNVNERRDTWREDFHRRFGEWVRSEPSISRAAAILNQRVFGQVGVKYSTKRPKPDQSPYESMEAGLASCTGLSILLIDACRAVGIPARFVGTPRWSDDSGNHSWVEVWDDGWHFTGAAEPTGDRLDEAWFVERARGAKRGDPRYGIFAVSFRRTPLRFPLVWDSGYDDLSAVDVTDRYTDRVVDVPSGKVRVRFRVIGPGRRRLTTDLEILDATGSVVATARTKDERFDANDHVTLLLDEKGDYRARARANRAAAETRFTAEEDEQLVTIDLLAQPSSGSKPIWGAAPGPIAALERYLLEPRETRAPLMDQEFATTSLDREEAERATVLLWDDLARHIRDTRADEVKEQRLRLGDREMRFAARTFGDAPPNGRSLFISMHGGGGTTSDVNDQQWLNQQRLYEPAEGIYLAPRAPTDTWDLWHQSHIDAFFDRWISNLIVFENVDPDRVYLMGYSAGGDGVFQLAPRMADRFAAAAMMAGHPNETSPLGLRNLGFTLHMGGRDAAYHRNDVARQWEKKLDELRAADPEGYPHWVEIHEDKGHWMDREDAAAVPWMAQFRRDVTPSRVVWVQDDVTHSRFYWLKVDAPKPRSTVIATCDGQTITIESTDVDAITLRLRDDLVSLEDPVRVIHEGAVRFEGLAPRTIATIEKTLAEREDPRGAFSAEVSITLPAQR